MHVATAETTSVSLLLRLRGEPANGEAWLEFVQRYRPRIHAFCRAYPLQPADADDVTQAVLLKLVVKLREFRYDPAQSFRAWLKTVTRNALCDFVRSREPDQASGDSAIQRLLGEVETREKLAQQIEAEFDQELLDEALRRVRPRVPPQQWHAFRLTALEGISGVQAAAQLKMHVTTVYTSKFKVQQLVREVIGRLEATWGCNR